MYIAAMNVKHTNLMVALLVMATFASVEAKSFKPSETNRFVVELSQDVDREALYFDDTGVNVTSDFAFESEQSENKALIFEFNSYDEGRSTALTRFKCSVSNLIGINASVTRGPPDLLI